MFTLPLKRRVCTGIVFACLIAMNITPMLQTLGGPIAFIAAISAVFDPFAAFLFIAGSQVAPDPPGFPLTLAQLFVACWAITLPLNGCLPHMAAVQSGMRYAFVFIVWWLIIGAINSTLDENWPYAWITCAIACTYLPRAKGQYHALLWMLVLGAGLALIGPWGSTLGLPVEGKSYEHFLRGGVRMGAGRGDVNVAAQNLGFFLWVAVALMVPAALIGNGSSRLKWSLAVVFTVGVASAAILSTGSRGGLGYLLLGGIATAGITLIVRSLSGAMLSRALVFVTLIFLTLPGLWPLFLETPPGKMMLATLDYNEQQARKAGGGTVAAGRAEIWGRFFDIALQYPLAGAPLGATVDMGEYGVVTLGEKGDGTGRGTGHNVWLDISTARGFAATGMFGILFFAPIANLVRRRGLALAYPFVIAHLMVFLVFFNLSVGNWKTYWALHALTAFAAGPPRTRLVHLR